MANYLKKRPYLFVLILGLALPILTWQFGYHLFAATATTLPAQANRIKIAQALAETPAVQAPAAPDKLIRVEPHGPALSPGPGTQTENECLEIPFPEKDGMRSEVYQGVPFQAGEEARYILKYGILKVHVGYGFLRVQPPTKYSVPIKRVNGQLVQESRWHRVLSAEAYTGDWYKMIFAGHDTMQAISRPWDFGVTKFYISQNEEKPFVRRFHAEKWLDFDHVTCNVHERIVDHKKKKESAGDHHLQPGALDAMGALYKLRTVPWTANKTERILVYTSEKNWWLEATQVASESVKTAAGTFKANKLTVKTYLGRDLQQKGRLFIWIAEDHPNHPMVRVQGEVTFGSIYLELDRFTPGAP